MRFYAENSEYPRVVDTKNRWGVVHVAPAYAYDEAKRVEKTLNRIWEREEEEDGIAPAASILCGYDPYPQPT